MNPRLMRLMKLHRLYREPAGEHGGDEGGGNGGGGGDDAAAAAAAEAAKAAAASEAAGKGAGGEGGTKPTDAEAALLKEVMAKKTALANANTELDEVKAKLKAFEGIDADAVKKLLQDQKDAEEAAALARGDFDKLKAQMAASHATEKTALQSNLDAERASTETLRKQIADLTVGGAFSGSKLIADELTLPLGKARVLYGSHFEFKDGAVVGFDKPAGAADRAPLVDAAGNPLGFDAALRKIVDADPDKDSLYRSKIKPGAGSSTTKTKPKDIVEKSNLTGSARIAAGLRAAAGKS